MTSTTSYNNYAPDNNIYSNSNPHKKPVHSPSKQMMNIFWLTIKRNLTLMIVYSVVLLINAPILLLLGTYSSVVYPADTLYSDTESIILFSAGLYGTIFTAVAIVFSIIASSINFSYMHNKRTVDTYYSLPVSRSSMLFGRYLGTLFVLIVPALAGSALCAATTLSFEASIVIIKFTLMLIIGIAAIVSFIMLLSVCCGTTGDTIVSFIIINIVYPLIILVSQIFPNTPLSGYSDAITNINGTVFCALSPTISPYFGMWNYNLKDGFNLQSVIHIVWFLVFIAACILVSRALIKTRKSEMAQSSFAFALPKVIIITLAAVLCGIILGWVFANIGYENANLQYFWFWVGAIIGSSAALTVLYALYHRGFKGFPKALILYGGLLVVSAAAFLCLINGWFGYETRVPDSQNVKSVSVDINNSYSVVSGVTPTFDDKEAINQVIDIHKSIIDENKDRPRYIVSTMLYDDDSAYFKFQNETYNELTIVYTLKNGGKIKRCYSAPTDSLKQSSKLVKNFMNSSDYLRKTNPVYSADPDTVSSATISLNIDLTSDIYLPEATLSKDDSRYSQICKELANAVNKDIKEDDHPYYNADNCVCSIELTYGDTDASIFGDFSLQAGTCYVKSSYKNTCRVLEKYGLNEPLLLQGYNNDILDYISQHYDVERTGKYIYFEVPSDWEGKQIYANFSDTYDSPLWYVKAPDSKCEHVKDNLWRIETVKYTEKDDYSPLELAIVYFYEYDSRNDRFNVTAEGVYKEQDKIYKSQVEDGVQSLIFEDYKQN